MTVAGRRTHGGGRYTFTSLVINALRTWCGFWVWVWGFGEFLRQHVDHAISKSSYYLNHGLFQLLLTLWRRETWVHPIRTSAEQTWKRMLEVRGTGRLVAAAALAFPLLCLGLR